MLKLRALLRTIEDSYRLDYFGIHGVRHWGRVCANGVRLARVTGADRRVVTLFAFLHDSQRHNDDSDPDHGRRAAEFAIRCRGELFDCDDRQLRLLVVACAHHTDTRRHPDATIATCWDADRLDLGRVGIMPRPDRMCTKAARGREMIAWANARSAVGF